MRVLIDGCVPAGVRESLAALGYEAETVRASLLRDCLVSLRQNESPHDATIFIDVCDILEDPTNPGNVK